MAISLVLLIIEPSSFNRQRLSHITNFLSHRPQLLPTDIQTNDLFTLFQA